MKAQRRESSFEDIELIILEDYVRSGVDSEGNEIVKSVTRDVKSKLTTSVNSIGTRREILINPKKGHYKNKFLVNIEGIGGVVVRGNLDKFNKQIENKQRLKVKGFKSYE